jgi:hypothetical protein
MIRGSLLTDVKEKDLPESYYLSQNYPNPFNPATTIKYELPSDALVQLRVYNTLGEEVFSAVNEEKKAGFYEFIFNAGTLPSGIYIYKIQAGEFTSVKKMLLIK